MSNATFYSFVQLLKGLEYWIDEHKAPHLLFIGCKNKFWYSDNLRCKLTDSNLLSYGMIKWDANNLDFTFHIQGDRKIAEAIDLFLKKAEAYLPSESRTKLRRYQQDCQARYHLKPKREPAPLSQAIDKYVTCSHSAISRGLHHVHLLQKKSSKSSKNKSYVYKSTPNRRPIAGIEAFNVECHRLLLGTDRHPKARPIHDNDNLPVGVRSTYVPDFVPFMNRYKQLQCSKCHSKGEEQLYCGNYINKKQQIRCGSCYVSETGNILRPAMVTSQLHQTSIIDIWVAAYLEEENDLHHGNYGFTSDGKSIKIDGDKTTWPLSCKFSLDGGIEQNDNTTYEDQAPIKTSIITPRDIQSFPRPLTDANIRFLSSADYGLHPGIIEALANMPETNERKYYLFLKRALIPDATYANFGKAYIQNEKIRNQYVEHKCERTRKLIAALLQTPEFLSYLEKNQATVLQQLEKDFESYNQTQKKFHVSLDAISTNLSILIKHMAEKTAPNNTIPTAIQKKSSNEFHDYDFIETKKKSKPSFYQRHPFASWVLISMGILLLASAAVFTCAYIAVPAVIAGSIAAIGLSIGIKSTIATAACLTAAGVGSYTAGSLVVYATKKIASLFFRKKTIEQEAKPTKDQQISTTSAPPRTQSKKEIDKSSHQAFFDSPPTRQCKQAVTQPITIAAQRKLNPTA